LILHDEKAGNFPRERGIVILRVYVSDIVFKSLIIRNNL
jgi:hypothetical protein